MLVMASVGFLLHKSDGIRSRFDPTVLHFADSRNDRHQNANDFYNVPLAKIVKNGFSRLDDGPHHSPPSVAVIGDSHANALIPVMRALATELNVPTICLCRSAVMPLAYDTSGKHSEYARYYQDVCAELRKIDSLTDVVVISRWGGPMELLTDQAWQQTMKLFESMGVQTWIVLPVPGGRVDVPRALAVSQHWGTSREGISLSVDEFQAIRDEQEKVLRAGLGQRANFIDPAPYFFERSDRAAVLKGNRPLYRDNTHVSTFGAFYLKPCFESMFLSIREQSEQRKLVNFQRQGS